MSKFTNNRENWNCCVEGTQKKNCQHILILYRQGPMGGCLTRILFLLDFYERYEG